jgi:hypothetical protein
MNKHQFLAAPIVNEFIKWMSNKLDSEFTHTYDINMNGPRNGVPRNMSWFRFNNGQATWQCNSIFHAYEQYYWEGINFSNTSILLNKFQVRLTRALEDNDQLEADAACYDILKWGGQRVFTHNYRWIQNLPDLVAYLNSSKNILNPNQFDDHLVQVQQNGVIRFNAGFTKIYSLCIDNFPMYDSRVAIALGILISEFLRSQKLSIIPDELRFRMPPGGTVTTRPSTINGFRFGATNLTTYQISNIRASWLLEAVLKNRPESQFNQLEPNEKIRALEAALFMIGYSI